MTFFQSLPLDVKVLLGAFVALGLVHFFSHNHKTQKYYAVILVLLAAGGLYRYQTTKPIEKTIAEQEHLPAVMATPARTPLVSTAGK
jgi:hypothetical protein